MYAFKHVGLTLTLINLILFFTILQEAFFLDIKFQQSDYDIKFERSELTRFNKDYMKLFKLITFKYNRTTPVVNLTFAYSVDVGFDIEVIIQAYVFLSNEYRVFPIRFEVNWCEAFIKNHAGLGGFSNCGNFTGCPFEKGRIYHVCNWTPQQWEFPPLIPDGRYMIEMQALFHDVEVRVIRSYGIIDRPIFIPKI